jgi:membrane protease YdiL (CAAX protease family)
MGIAGWFHVAAFGLLFPLLSFRGKRKLEKGGAKLPPKRAYLASLLVQLLILGSISAAVARFEGIRILLPLAFTGGAIAFALGVFAVHAVVGFFRSRLRVRRRDPKLWLVTPNDGVERALWVCISLAAALGEEIAYRGVLIELVQRMGAGFPLAVALCALAFGLSHSTQSWTAAAIITGYAVLMHLLAAYSGSLYLGMAVHFLHDLWIGLFIAWMARREGWKPQLYAEAVPEAGSGSP